MAKTKVQTGRDTGHAARPIPEGIQFNNQVQTGRDTGHAARPVTMSHNLGEGANR